MAQFSASTEKLIKAINERMAVYERNNLTASAVYQDLQRGIEIMGIPSAQSKRAGGGRVIARTKEAAEFFKTQQGQQALQRLNIRGGLKEERAQVRKNIKAEKKALGIKKPKVTEAEIGARIRQYGELQTWAENNLTYLYSLSNILPEAAILQDNFDQGIRNLSYDYIFSLIKDFENAAAEWERRTADSGLKAASKTPVLATEYYNPYV